MRSLFAVLLLVAPLFLSAQDPEVWEQVRAKYDRDDVYSGIRKCDRMLSGKPPQNEFLVLRAEGFNRIGEYEKAVRDARSAYAMFAGEHQHAAALQLGIGMAAMGVPDSARFWLERSLGSKDDSEAYFRLGLMDRVKGENAKAIASFERVLAVFPDRTNVLMERGSTYALMGDSAAARRDLDHALALAPEDPVVLNSHGYYLYALNGRYIEAIADYDKAIKHDPNYSYAFNNRGWAYYKLGDTERALKNIDLARRKKEGNPYVYRNLGIIALEMGEIDRACSHFHTALAMRFTALHGDEVEELVRANCGQVTPKNQKPLPSNAPGKTETPRTNAPVRNNAP